MEYAAYIYSLKHLIVIVPSQLDTRKEVDMSAFKSSAQAPSGGVTGVVSRADATVTGA